MAQTKHPKYIFVVGGVMSGVGKGKRPLPSTARDLRPVRQKLAHPRFQYIINFRNKYDKEGEMFLAMKRRSRGCGQAMLPETKGEVCAYFGSIITLFAGIFFLFTGAAHNQMVDPPWLLRANPIFWFLIGVVLVFVGLRVLIITDAHQRRRTNAARQATPPPTATSQ